VRIESILEEHVAFERWLTTLRGRTARFGGIAATRNDALPRVHDANMAWVDAPAATTAALEAWWAEAFRGAPAAHRKFAYPSALDAHRQQGAFVAAGYRPGAAFVLLLAGETDCVLNDEVRLRPVTAGHPGFVRVRRAVLEEAYGRPVAAQLLREEVAEARRSRRRNFLATLRGAPAGTIALHRRGSLGVVDVVGTAPSHRRKGVGLTMVARLNEESRRAGLPSVTLAVDAGNPARAIYERLGYVAIGELRWFLREGPSARTDGRIPGAVRTTRRSNMPK
jgi:GNAT superfamily N-acetyltransferase